MEYRELNSSSVISYLQTITEVNEYFGGDELKVDEIGDGNLNYVYLVSSSDDNSKALIVKQAVPYLRCVGEEFPLSRERMTYEIRALDKFYSIFPNFIPKIYHSSEDMSLVVMQYLDNHIIMRKGLIQKQRYPSFSEDISTYLSSMLFYTSSLYMQSDEKRKLIDKFNSNTQLCKLTEDFVFGFAFMQNETNDNENVNGNKEAEKLFSDMEFKAKVLDLKYKFMTNTDALIHGDLHTGSIMLNKNETYVIDPEFAFVGPFGFDIGALLANMVNSYIHHCVITKDEEYKSWILQTTKEFLDKTFEKFLDFWAKCNNSALLIDGYLDEESLKSYKERFIKNIFRDSVGYAGCKMARRVFGVAGVEEIRGIEDIVKRHEAEALALKISKEFVMRYESLNSVDDVLEIIKSAR